jgi:hypothetical protein
MATHTASGEWQSFEVRMQRRRAERLILRAEVALEAGFHDDAHAAIVEAARLWPDAPRLSEVEARFTAAPAPSVGPLVRRSKLDATPGLAAALIVAIAVTFAMARTWKTDGDPVQPHTVPAAPAELPQRHHAKPALNDSVTIQTRAIRPVVWPGHSDQLPQQRHLGQAQPVQVSAAVDPGDTNGLPAPPTDVHRPRTDETSDIKPDVAKQPAAAVAELAPIPAPEMVRSLPSSSAPSTTNPVPEATVGGKPPPASPAAHAVGDSGDAPEAVPASLARRSDEPATPSEAELVRGVLHRYADAYTRLDAAAAQAVWPSVNRAALSRAFGDLAEQEIALGTCNIDVRDAVARASCAGSATWAPKVGSGGARTDTRRWSFELHKSNDGWLISEARVQNR